MTQPGASPTREGTADSAAAPLSPGDRLTSVFHEMRDELVSTLLYVLGNRDDAQDAAQEAFVKCWRARDTVPDVQNLRAWIFRVGLNAAKDLQRSAWHRKAKAFAGDETAIVGRDLAPGQALEDQEDQARLRAAILDLRPDEKEVFLLRQNGGFTYEEIAVLRAAPVGTVKTQMRSALMKLRKVLAGPQPRPAAPDPEES
jgi:RNA polymerase sigma-70 factor (ECF subfamily)